MNWASKYPIAIQHNKSAGQLYSWRNSKLSRWIAAGRAIRERVILYQRNTLVAIQLSVAAPRADGSMYRNEVMQFLHLRWGKVVEDRLYEDTYKLAGELQERLSRKETVVQD